MLPPVKRYLCDVASELHSLPLVSVHNATMVLASDYDALVNPPSRNFSMTNPTQQTLQQLLTERVALYATSERPIELIDAGVDKLFKEVIDDVFRSYGDMGIRPNGDKVFTVYQQGQPAFEYKLDHQGQWWERTQSPDSQGWNDWRLCMAVGDLYESA